MKFTATLVTSRSLERGIQKFGSDLKNVEWAARQILAGQQPGDKFEVFEMRSVLVSTLVRMSDGSVDRYPAEGEGK